MFQLNIIYINKEYLGEKDFDWDKSIKKVKRDKNLTKKYTIIDKLTKRKSILINIF